MWLLAILLPVLIAFTIPVSDPNWICFGNLAVTGKRFAHATGPLVNNVKLRSGSPGQIFSRQVLGWTAQ